MSIIFNKILNKYQFTLYNIMTIKKAPEYSGAFFIILISSDYFFFSARPNGLVFEKSTNTGAATNIEE